MNTGSPLHRRFLRILRHPFLVFLLLSYLLYPWLERLLVAILMLPLRLLFPFPSDM